MPPNAASSSEPAGREAAYTLHEFEERLKRTLKFQQEVEAMLLIAQRERNEALAHQAELKAEQEQLLARVATRRTPGSSALRNGIAGGMRSAPRIVRFPNTRSGSGSDSGTTSPRGRNSRDESDDHVSVYDWVCEITKLSDVATEGWTVRYSTRFLASLTDGEREQVMGMAPIKVAPEEENDDDDAGGVEKGGWEGAVVAVLGLFDKGKTFLLNRITDSDLPSGKKVSTKGLSFKHVDVEGTKFVVLDSEGSYAPVKVENELSVVEKEISEKFIQDVIFELADYFLCVVNDFTSLDQRYLDRLTRSLQNSKKVFKEVIVVHNCKTVMEAEVMQHIFESQIMHVYGKGKMQTTRIAAVNRLSGELEEHDVHWFKTDFSRHVLLANEDCELGDRTNPWSFALLKNWLRSAFVPVNRRFSVLQSVLQSCNARLSSYFKAHPELIVNSTDDRRVKVIRARAAQDQMRLQQTSIDASGLLLMRPNHFMPYVDIRKEKKYTIFLDVPGMTKEDIKLSRQNVTTIVKGSRSRPYPELQVQKIERSECTYGDFTLTFAIPQEYERRWSSMTLVNGVLRLVFTPDADEDGLVLSSCIADDSTSASNPATTPSSTVQLS